jgi:hypothetical protein
MNAPKTATSITAVLGAAGPTASVTSTEAVSTGSGGSVVAMVTAHPAAIMRRRGIERPRGESSVIGGGREHDSFRPPVAQLRHSASRSGSRRTRPIVRERSDREAKGSRPA